MRDLVIFGHTFSTYWTMLVLAAVLTVVLSFCRAKHHGFGKIKALIIAVLLLVYGCVGAKLLYMLENPGSVFSLRGGMSLYGSVYFIPAAMLITAWILRTRFARCMDFVAMYGPLIFAFMRIGCYLTDCCGGRSITLFGETFVPPVQLMECFLDVAIFGFLYYYERRKIKPGSGLLYPIFMVLYGLIRFCIEFLRDTPKNLWHLSEGQWLSTVSILLGADILWMIKKLKKKKNGVLSE